MRWFAVFVGLLGLGLAQTWYYEVPTALAPPKIHFRPSTRDLLCAAILAPPKGVGTLNVSELPRPDECPDSPPIVIYGEDELGNPIYGVTLTVKFWGERRYQDRNYGVKALIRLLKNNYAYRILAQGDLTQVRAEYQPPLTLPPLDHPPVGGIWKSFTSQQDLRIGDAKIQKATNYYWWDQESQICIDLFNRLSCWSAELIWVLPVRSTLQGYEQGNLQISLEPEYFHALARTLRASPQGKLEWAGKVQPFQR